MIQTLNVVVLCADLTESTRSLAFKKAYPDRVIQMGVSEQSLAAIAAGLPGRLSSAKLAALVVPAVVAVAVKMSQDDQPGRELRLGHAITSLSCPSPR